MAKVTDEPLDQLETLARPRPETANEDVATFVLTVVEGPDAGVTFALDGARPRVLIGTGPACELRLSDRHVSRRHVAVEATPQGLHVTDVGSLNGTWLQNARLQDAYVGPQEVLRLGETALRVDVAAAPHPVQVSSAMSFGRTYGASLGMRRLYPLLERLAASDVPVVIEGETGTGKELLAESIHEASARANAPFVVFDCTAVPGNLIESALFGHEKGAFTNALGARKGVFELADGGTLLIDEIGELDPSLQPKLLRALERSEVQRLGSEKWTKVDVRVLAATRRDLDREVQEGRFREDLFYRLAVTRVELPPLRERHGDIGLLTRTFWRKLDTKGQPMPDDLIERFEAYAWPGNARELRNAVLRRIALGDLADAGGPGSMSASGSMPPPSGAPAPVAPSTSSAPSASSASSAPSHALFEEVLAKNLPLPRARQLVLDEFERRYVEDVLAKHDGNVTRAAHASGIARRHFYTIRTRVNS
jgi:two-component system response regulator HydG